jgi:hypothetical protein
MIKAWDSDRRLLIILLVAAAISLAVSYKDVLADTAGRLVQKVEGTLGELRSKLPTQSPRLNRTSARQGSFDPREGRSCDPGCGQADDGSVWYGTVDCWRHVRGVRHFRTGDGCSH